MIKLDPNTILNAAWLTWAQWIIFTSIREMRKKKDS